MANNLLSTVELVEKANKVLSKHADELNKSALQMEALNKQYKLLPSEYIKAIKQNAVAEKELNKAKQANIVTSQKLADLKAKEARAAAAENRAKVSEIALEQKKILAQERASKVAIREAAISEKANNLYHKIQQRINELTKRYNDLATKKELYNNLTKKEQKELTSLTAKIQKYDTALKKVDSTIGKNNRHVGNYGKALGKLRGTLSTLMSAFGLYGGIYLFANAIRSTFNRIREFDKAMQNIAGVMRTSRSEIKDLETEIKRVSSTSIKTAREVAGLAESLVTLGKTKKEIKDLLKPVTDLAIGLEASTDETAEFLVQTLNAFGAGSDEAEKYADTIATIRTSTTLDFQKMRDSFQYLTPISRILNKDLAYTGAVIGILADNGLKAESAGRLLGTAQQKLAKEGKTLRDALNEINIAVKEGKKEVELLEIASNLFGKQAAKVGVILASNSDIIEVNSQKIRENGGALDDLVNQQLESLDAKIKILDATWEDFILGIENGTGVFGDFVKTTISGMTKIVKALKYLNEGYEEPFRKKQFDTQFEQLKKSNTTLEDSRKQLKNYREAINKTERSLDVLDGAFSNNIILNKEQLKTYKDLINQAKEENITLFQKEKNLKRSLVFLKGQADAYREYSLLLVENKKANNENVSEEKENIISLIMGKNQMLKKIDLEKMSIKELTDLYAKLNKAKNGSGGSNTEKQVRALDELKTALKAVGGTFGNIETTDLLNDKQYQDTILDAEANLERAASLEKLREATKSYLSSFSDDFIKNSPLSGLQMFIDGTFENLMEGANTTSEEFAVAFNSIAEVAKQAFSFIDGLGQQNFEAQLSRLEKSREYHLQFANGNAAAEAEINRQADEKRTEILKRQAEADKKNAIFQTLINTAQAVVSVLAQEPGGVIKKGIAAAIIGGMGLAQIAAIKSAPTPEFWQGGYVGNEREIKVNDDPYKKKGKNYKEVIEKPNGQLLFPQGKNVKMKVPNGTFVHPTYDDFMSNKGLNNLMPLGQSIIAPMLGGNGLNKSDILDVMDNHANKLVNTINNKESFIFSVDENGMNKRSVKNGQRRVILNARYSGRGYSV